MPELPEVETIVRTLRPLIQGAYIEQVQVYLPRILDSSGCGSLPVHLLQGRRISDVQRRGKLVLLMLEPLGSVYDGAKAHMVAVHLKMTGRLFVYSIAAMPQKHTRVVWHLQHAEERKQLFFDDARTFGYVRVVSPDSLSQWPFWQSLGLEPLEHSAQVLAQCYVGKKAGIKGLLLNQSLVVGIGNIYADEALFQAGIAPQRKASTLSLEQLVALLQAVQAVLRLSIEQCGSSIRDYRDAHGNAGAFQNTFMVYGRSGEACKACGHELSTAKVAGRTTVYCNVCQQ